MSAATVAGSEDLSSAARKAKLDTQPFRHKYHQEGLPLYSPASNPVAKKPWYKDGLCFECTQCGECCTGEPGLVQFTEAEGQNMAAQLGLSVETFLERYAQKSVDDNCWELMEEQTEFGFDCVLLERCDKSGKTFCRAHDSRPIQCRTWPFWPDNLRSRKAWNRAAKSCEGIGLGPLIPLRVIQDDKERTPEWGRTP